MLTPTLPAYLNSLPTASSGAESVFTLAFSLFVLLYACYWDIKQRTVSNVVWGVMLLIGVPFVLYRVFSDGVPYAMRVGYSLGVTSAICYLFFRFHLIGGADAKSLICIAAIFPAQPSFVILSQHFPIYGTMRELFPFALLTLLYALPLALLIPVYLLFFNLRDLGARGLLRNLGNAVLGYKLPIDELTRRNVKLLHVYEEMNGSLRRRLSPGGVPIDGSAVQMFREYHKQGKMAGQVWVTPEVPFLIFITCGFVTSTFLGRLFWG